MRFEVVLHLLLGLTMLASLQLAQGDNRHENEWKHGSIRGSEASRDPKSVARAGRRRRILGTKDLWDLEEEVVTTKAPKGGCTPETPSPTAANKEPKATKSPKAPKCEAPSNAPSASAAPSTQPSTSPFDVLLSLQNTPGVCATIINLGCNSLFSTGGNPNDFANCYNIQDFGGSPPFFIYSMNFWMSRDEALPKDLSIRIWNGTTTMGPNSTEIIYEQPLNITNVFQGNNTFALDMDVKVTTDQVCVGLYSSTKRSGGRLSAEAGTGTFSFLQAPVCDLDTFTTLKDVGRGDVDYCIEAAAYGGGV